MSIGTIRRSRLRQLLREKYNGQVTAFERETGYAHTRLSQILNSEMTPFGERVARKIEVLAKLPSGWLDGPDFERDGLDETLVKLLKITIRALYYRQQELGDLMPLADQEEVFLLTLGALARANQKNSEKPDAEGQLEKLAKTLVDSTG